MPKIVFLYATVVTILGFALGLFIGLQGIGEYYIDFDINTIIHLITILVLFLFTNIVYGSILYSHSSYRKEIESKMKTEKAKNYIYYALISMFITGIGAILATIYLSLPHMLLCGLIIIYFGFCTFNLLTINIFTEEALNESETANLTGNKGISYLMMVQNWLRTSDLPTFVGLVGLFLLLIIFYITISPQTTEEALKLHSKIHDFVTGAAAFHILVSQVHFYLSNKELLI